MDFDGVLGQLRVLLVDGERIASRLAATSDCERVLDVLCDRPRLRTLRATVAGVVARAGDDIYIRVGKKPTRKDLAEAAESSGPLGTWVGDGWFVPAPAQLLVSPGTSIGKDESLAICRCTLDELLNHAGNRECAAAIAADLPELEPDHIHALAELMTGYVEELELEDSLAKRGIVMPVAEFLARNEQRPGAERVANPRLLAIPAISTLQPPATQVAAQQRAREHSLVERLRVTPDPVLAEHYIHVSRAALSAPIVIGVRGCDELPLTGWEIVAADESPDDAQFGYYTIPELEREGAPWLIALCLPQGWRFSWVIDHIVICIAPDGTRHDL